MGTGNSDVGFVLFGPAHLMIIVLVPAFAGLLAWIANRNPWIAGRIRVGLGIFLLLNELAWYGYLLHHDYLSFPESLPLHLSDIVLWVTVVACLTLKLWSYEIAYFTVISGGGLAIITPDVGAPLTSYPAIHFFLSHGSAIIAVLFLTWTGMVKPRPGAMWRVLLYMNIYAVLVGIFNYVFDTNYMYLCQKPAGETLLDYMGPWPFYIIAGEILAIGLFAVLWFPLRRRSLKG